MASPISPVSSQTRLNWTRKSALFSSRQGSIAPYRRRLGRMSPCPCCGRWSQLAGQTDARKSRNLWDHTGASETSCLAVEDGLVTKGDHIIVPTPMQQEILSGIHTGYQGSKKCKLRARTCVYWYPMNNDIEELVSECPTCQTHRKSHQPETLLPHEVASQPWKVLGSDMLTLHGHDYLLVCD